MKFIEIGRLCYKSGEPVIILEIQDDKNVLIQTMTSVEKTTVGKLVLSDTVLENCDKNNLKEFVVKKKEKLSDFERFKIDLKSKIETGLIQKRFETSN